LRRGGLERDRTYKVQCLHEQLDFCANKHANLTEICIYEYVFGLSEVNTSLTSSEYKKKIFQIN
jgi:hypothetical protein